MAVAVHTRIGVAGGGLSGSLLAWRLLRAGGYDVSVYDARAHAEVNCASYIAGGMLAPYSEVVKGEAEIARLGEDSLVRWHGLLAELSDETGADLSLNTQGSLVIAHAADDCELDHFATQLRSKVAGCGTHWHVLDKTELHRLEPELTGFDKAVYLPEEACLDNRAVLEAIRSAIEMRGGTWHWGARARSVDARTIHLEDGAHAFDWVADCRGAGAIGDWAGLRGVRGEIIRVHAPEVHLSRPVRLLHPRYALYVVPHPHQVYAIGATEIESDAHGAMTVRSSLELLSAMFSMHSGFAEAEVLSCASAVRSAFEDNLPCWQVRSGLARLNGLYRHGYLLAPRMVESVMDALSTACHSKSPLGVV